MSEKFGEFLRALRKAKGITLMQLQEKYGVSNSYISQVENGQFKPSPEILRKLSEAYQVNYISLLIQSGYITNGDIEEYVKQK